MVMATPSPQQVGREFVRQYYTVLHEAPEVLHRFYSSGSAFVHSNIDRSGLTNEEPVIGQLEIDKKIRMLNFKDCHTKIRQVDSQTTIGSGVVVQVTGELSNNGEPMRRFMQTFVLAPQTPKKFYVHNDIFRYQDEVYQDNSDTESEDPPQQHIEQHVASKQHPANNIIDYYQQAEVVEQQQQEQPMQSMPDQMHQNEMAVKALLIQQEPQHISNGHYNPEQIVAAVVLEQIPVSVIEENKQTVELFIENQKPVELIGNKPTQQNQVAKENQVPISDPDVKSSWAKIITTRTSSSSGNTDAVDAPKAPQQNHFGQHSHHNQQPTAHAKKEHVKKAPSSNGPSSNGPTNGIGAKEPVKKSRSSMGGSQQANQQQVGQMGQQQAPRSVTITEQNGTSAMSMERPTGETYAEAEKRFGRFPDGQQVFVGNLNQDLSETELKGFFGQYGRVVEVRINSNSKQQSGRRLPNYGFVVFDDKVTVDNLLGVNKSNNLTYKSDKGIEYRLNVEEKRARAGRMSNSNFGGNRGGQRTARSSSNGSRGPTNGPAVTKKPFNNAEGQAGDQQQFFEKRKDTNLPMTTSEGANNNRNNFNSRRS